MPHMSASVSSEPPIFGETVTDHIASDAPAATAVASRALPRAVRRPSRLSSMTSHASRKPYPLSENRSARGGTPLG